MNTLVRRVLVPLALLLAACQPSTATPPARVFPTPLPRQASATPAAAQAPASAAPVAPTRAPVPPADLPAAVREQLAPIGPLDTPMARQADPLPALQAERVLSATVLLVAEPTHGAHEFAVLRERLIKQRLQAGGLIVFLETDWGSALALDEYVAHDRGDAQSAVAMQGNGWNSDELLEMVDLLHAHNRDLPLTRRARILGYDAGRPALLMDAVEAFVQRSGDAELLRQIRQHYACLRPYARIATGYAALPVSATSECRAELQAVPVALGRSVHVGSDVEAYVSAKMSANMVLQAEDLMMAGDTPDARALRTRYQADTIADVVRLGARVVAFVRTHQADLAAQAPKSIGSLLREQFGSDVRAVALTHARGSFLSRPALESNSVRVASAPPPGAFESAFAAVDGAFVLQTHTAEVTAWLGVPRLFRAGTPRYDEADPETHFAPLALARSFDAIIFVPEVTPATLLAPGPTAGLFPAPRNLDFEDGTEGWWTFTGNPLQYAFGADLREPHSGMYSLSLGSEGSARVPTRRGTVGQTVSAARFRGKRLRVSAFLRTQAVEQRAGLIVAMSPARSPTFALAIRDDMTGRELRGTTPWQRHDIVVDVPNTEMSLAFGVWLDGRGTVWMDDVRVEAVGDEIATTYGTGLLGAARNLDFHNGVDGWNVEANAWSEWEFKAAGAGAATLASTVTRTDGGAAAQQAISAVPYRGRTLRLSGMVRGIGVRGGAGLMLSASSARMVWNAERPTPPIPSDGWIRQSVQLVVPETADIVHLQLWLDGRGRLEVKDLALEILAP